MPVTIACGRKTLPVATACWKLALDPGFSVPQEATDWRTLRRGPHSRLYRLAGSSPSVAKLIVPRSKPRDVLRKYVNCQAKREFQGSLALRAIGLSTPTVFGWGMTLAPAARYESVLFMQTLPEFVSGLAFIREETSQQRRLSFLHRLAEQLARLLGHGYIHKDCHFANLCLLADGTLVWIDNDIRRPRNLAGRRLGLQKSLALLERTARNDIAPCEWRTFRGSLRAALARWPQGEQLVHEVC